MLSRIAIYLVGFFITGAGVVLLIRTEHAGPWDAVSANFSAFISHFLWEGFTVGMGSFTVNVTIMLSVTLLRKRPRFLFMLVPILGISASIDIWNEFLLAGVLEDLEIIGVALLFLFGTVVLTFGLSTIVMSGFPAMVFEELMLLIMDAFNIRSIFAVRLGLELFAITLASIFGFAAGEGFGVVGVGSLVLAFIIAPILAYQMHWMKGVIYERTSDKSHH